MRVHQSAFYRVGLRLFILAFCLQRTLSYYTCAVCSDFKYLPSEVKGRALRILHKVLQRIVPALGGDGGGGGRRSARDSRRGVGADEGGEREQQQQQHQAGLSLRNAFKMAVYLIFSAAFPAEECYSSAKQVLLV